MREIEKERASEMFDGGGVLKKDGGITSKPHIKRNK